jgi:sugar lactone lactonase YvrE
MLRSSLLLALIAVLVLVPAAPAGTTAQRTIALADEFRPEGIASGPKASFFAGSIPQGSVYRGSYRTGEGDVLVPPHQGRNHVGLKYAFGKLFVAGGGSKGIYVYDARTGADRESFALPGAGFVNDVVVTRRAAWFTDSQVQQLYRVAIAKDGSVGAPTAVPISGDFAYTPGFNANGIEALPGGRKLIVVQTNLGKLYTVDAKTGASREIALNRPVTNGDGILLRGRTLYVVQNQENRVAVVKLKRGLERGRVVRYLRSPELDVPTTIAPFKRFVYAVNARFDRPDDSEADIVRLRPRGPERYADPFRR